MLFMVMSTWKQFCWDNFCFGVTNLLSFLFICCYMYTAFSIQEALNNIQQYLLTRHSRVNWGNMSAKSTLKITSSVQNPGLPCEMLNPYFGILSAQHTTPGITLQGDRSDYLHGWWQLLLVPLGNTLNNFQGFVIFLLGYQPSWGFWKTPVKQCTASV